MIRVPAPRHRAAGTRTINQMDNSRHGDDQMSDNENEHEPDIDLTNEEFFHLTGKLLSDEGRENAELTRLVHTMRDEIREAHSEAEVLRIELGPEGPRMVTSTDDETEFPEHIRVMIEK